MAHLRPADTEGLTWRRTTWLFGRLVDAVSHSKFWPRTAIFVVEDDAQNGPDHVDAHPHHRICHQPLHQARCGGSTMYSTSSMLRTMELILGLKPMSQFDTAATPMFNSFQAAPNLRPYNALPINVDLEERNGLHAWGGKLKMDFSGKMPRMICCSRSGVALGARRGQFDASPTRAAFVFPHEKDDD